MSTEDPELPHEPSTEELPAIETEELPPQALDDPILQAEHNLAAWMAAGKTTELVENYALLPRASLKKRALDWALGEAQEGRIGPLLDMVSREELPQTLAHVSERLEALPADKLMRFLERGLESNVRRRAVAFILGHCRDEHARENLRRMVTDNNVWVRESALRALASPHCPPEFSIPIFRRAIEIEPQENVRLAAANGLLAIGSNEAYEAFRDAMREKPPSQALKALLHRLKIKALGPEEAPVQEAARGSGVHWRLPTSRKLWQAVALSGALLLVGFAAWLAVREVTRHKAVQEPLAEEEFLLNRSK